MKLLNLAISAVIGLTATVASAQPTVTYYDTFPGAGGTVTYYTGPGHYCVGDVMRLIPPWNATDLLDNISVLFVATAPGTYNVCLNYFSGYVFPNPLPCCICPGGTGGSPITIPAGGVFPSVWQVNFSFNPAIPIGPNDQAVVVGTSSSAFVPAFANQAAMPPGTDVPPNFFTVDTNQNCLLEPGPPVNEAYNFGPGFWNLALQITQGPTPLAQPFACNGSSVSVAPVPELTAVPAKELISTRTNNKL